MSTPTAIIKRNGDVVPFDASKITTAIYKAGAAVGVHDMDLAERLADEVVRLLSRSGGTPSVEETQDLVEEVLIEHKQARIAKAYILYREDRARQRRARERAKRGTELVPYRTMWQTLVWNLEQDCYTLDGLNRHVRDGTFPRLVTRAEAAYDEQLRAAARAILDTHGTRLVIVAGPSSSGKTTTTTRLTQLLAEGGMQVQPLTLDNYFFDLRLHPRDASGDPDYETPEALDLQLVNEHLAALLAGREIAMPIYDFKLGRRLAETRPLRLHSDQCLLLDTLHGMYEPLTRSIDDDVKFRVYIETVLQLRDHEQRWVRWTDLRLLRRMMRDAAHRNSDPASTVAHWHYVRRGELKHIIPNQSRAEFVLNGALPYELPVFKRHLAHHFPRFVAMWRDDPARADALGRARRIGALLDAVLPADDACVPPTSVLREFIGGSAYDVH